MLPRIASLLLASLLLPAGMAAEDEGRVAKARHGLAVRKVAPAPSVRFAPTGISKVVGAVAFVGATYLLFAYGLIPAAYRRARLRHPALTDAPRVVLTPAGVSGDPLNIVLLATEEQAVRSMLAAGWHPADPTTLRSSLRIAGSTFFHRPYEEAPISRLLLWGRQQDLAFEQPVGHDARRRHHVRLWHGREPDLEGREAWFGAASFDRSVGFSHATGQITHHIGPEVDAERDKIVADLQRAGVVDVLDWIDDFQPKAEGRNGGGDIYRTDRRLAVVVLRSASASMRDGGPPKEGIQ